MVGQIKHLVKERGFGFLDGPNGDVFFHVLDMHDQSVFLTLEKGLHLDYELVEGRDGRPRARNVSVADRVPRRSPSPHELVGGV